MNAPPTALVGLSRTHGECGRFSFFSSLLDKATFVLAFVSKLSFDRRGYLQRALKLALDRLTEKLVDDIYLIPVLLDDDVQIPDQLSHLQCIRASDPKCRNHIKDALQHQLERLGFQRQEIQRDSSSTGRLRFFEKNGTVSQDMKLNCSSSSCDLTFTRRWLR